MEWEKQTTLDKILIYSYLFLSLFDHIFSWIKIIEVCVVFIYLVSNIIKFLRCRRDPVFKAKITRIGIKLETMYYLAMVMLFLVLVFQIFTIIHFNT
ncbi:hypothetical protein Ga0466249_001520 [Sporomusaceae bacterium BoRhaA]|uniref:hypothetical protein n=1 Tax=Pelorhabdus rhamnosifermentans TaxID=2772457 RepID=UPI001C05ED88|nr:hypothetical protein [Pelorhabdus rhamnosifermentans]MBU2700428.1 hypothetical protein [Pelorhabdus rhamnosifermentans]